MNGDDGTIAREEDVHGRYLDVHAFALLQCVDRAALVPVRAPYCGLFIDLE